MDEDQRFIFAVYIVAKDEDEARDLMRRVEKVIGDDEAFIDEWHAIAKIEAGQVFRS